VPVPTQVANVAPPVPAAPPKFSLLSTLTALGALRGAAAGDHVLRGVKYAPLACGIDGAVLPMGVDAAGGGSLLFEGANADDKPDPDARPDVQTDIPFLVTVVDECSTLDKDNPDGDYRDRVRAKMRIQEDFLVEQEFYNGTAAQAAATAGVTDWSLTGKQWLTGAATVVASGAAQPLRYALGLLAEAAGSAAVGTPWYHLPRRAIHLAGNLIIREERSGVAYAWDDGPMIFGVGYDNDAGSGTGTDAGPNSDIPDAHQAWIYATSPIRAWRDNDLVLGEDNASALTRTTGGIPKNSIRVRAERAYVLDWDHCATFACLVDLAAGS
jgi:hypothetical protein